jgi:pimeloyl-ACP methyl ester carboxylesterase
VTAVELHRWQSGAGTAVICIHETAVSSEVWRSLAAELGEYARTIAFDRRGWGRSEAPEPYTRTTVHEQAEDTARIVIETGAAPAILCGAGLGAVAALDLVLHRSTLARAAVLIEPPLLAFVDEATERLSEDGVALREAVQGGGPAAGVELYLGGGLPALGPGAGRLPDRLASAARDRPLSLFAELGAVPSWSLPLVEMARNRIPARIVVFESSPPLVRRAAEALAGRLAESSLRELPGADPAHLADPRGLAALIGELV